MFLAKSRIIDICYLFALHIFVAWNGVQFFYFPIHLSMFVEKSIVWENIILISTTQKGYVPLYIFIIGTILGLYFYLKHIFEIRYYLEVNKIRICSQEQFHLFLNYTVPSFFYNILFLVLLLIIYSFLVAVYLLLIFYKIVDPLSQIKLVQFFLTYLVSGIILFNIWVNDFILPKLVINYSFTQSILFFMRYWGKNFRKIIYFYLVKIICIITSLLLLVLVLKYYPNNYLSIYLTYNYNLVNGLYNLIMLFWGAIVSMFLYAFIICFFNVGCTKLYARLFRNYH